MDPTEVALRDARLSGWCNDATGELVADCPVGPGDVVLHLGLATPEALRFCAGRGATQILADADPARLARGREWVRAWRAVEPETHVTDGDPLPLADGAVDRVVCDGLSASDPAALLAELARVARPGAILVISAPDPARAALGAAAPLGREAFRALAEDAGLTVLHQLHGGFFRAMWSFLAEGVGADPGHPVLAEWTRTWDQVLAREAALPVKRALDRFLPGEQVIVARRPARAAAAAGGRVSAASRAFTRIYEDDAWRLADIAPEPERHQLVADLLTRVIRAHGVTSVTEFGCGFWNYQTRVDWSGLRYTGYDVWPGVLSHNARHFGSDTIEFRLMSDEVDFAPGDLLFSKDVLQHLPLADVRHFLARFKARFGLVLLINDIAPEDNLNGDIPVGGHRALRFDLPPFRERYETVAEWAAPAFGVDYRKRACLFDMRGPA